MRHLLPLLALSCAVAPSADRVQAPPPALPLAATPMIPGGTGTVWLDGLPPGTEAHLAASPRGVGNGPCPRPLNGACLSLAGTPVYLGSAVADASGTARWDLSVPTAVTVDAVSFQAAVLNRTPAALSDTVTATTADLSAPGPFTTTSTTDRIQFGGGLFPTTIDLTIVRADRPDPAPVIVLHHGFQLSASDYASTARHLAGWGYVVVSPDMPGSILSPRTHTELASDLSRVVDRLDALGLDPASPYGGIADSSRLVVSGHSLGGKISMLFASGDARADAVFGIDPVDSAPPFGGSNPADYPSVTPELMDQVLVPLAMVGETLNGTGGLFGQPCAPEDDNFQRYTDAAVSPVVEIDILGADHQDFLDNPNCLSCLVCTQGSVDPDDVKAITRRVFTAFVGLELEGREGYDAALVGASRADQEAGAVLVRTANRP